jgi:hypothetical protein
LIDFREVNGEWLGKLKAAMAAEARRLPTHQVYIDQHCKASSPSAAIR